MIIAPPRPRLFQPTRQAVDPRQLDRERRRPRPWWRHGLQRFYANHRRCCCAGCPTLLMTLDGIDAARCTCFGTVDIAALAVDGTYELAPTGTSGDLCLYELTIPLTPGFIDYRDYTDGDCTGDLLYQDGGSGLEIDVTYNRATGKILNPAIDVVAENPGGFSGGDQISLWAGDTGVPYDLESPITNIIEACDGATAANGGTAEFALA